MTKTGRGWAEVECKLHTYQELAMGSVIDKPATGLFLDMGLRQNFNNVNSYSGAYI